MTRAEYLKLRGWVRDMRLPIWYDPRESDNEQIPSLVMQAAVTVQLARDAEEERELHRAVLAARMSIGHAARDGGMVRAFGANAADEEAAEAVDLYRRRFAVEFTD